MSATISPSIWTCFCHGFPLPGYNFLCTHRNPAGGCLILQKQVMRSHDRAPEANQTATSPTGFVVGTGFRVIILPVQPFSPFPQPVPSASRSPGNSQFSGWSCRFITGFLGPRVLLLGNSTESSYRFQLGLISTRAGPACPLPTQHTVSDSTRPADRSKLTLSAAQPPLLGTHTGRVWSVHFASATGPWNRLTCFPSPAGTEIKFHFPHVSTCPRCSCMGMTTAGSLYSPDTPGISSG